MSGAGEGGFVYVSMGTSVNTEKMPPHLLRTLVDAFAKLAPYRVLWKFEGSLGDDLPANVKVERWLPQQDILGESVTGLWSLRGRISFRKLTLCVQKALT